ncbi:sugar transferase [Thalassobius vesicularis]|uniref:Sugar transferase n=1 Tax=Thalassobius vesicularis TaxID=1294297 RepID=A0A4S3MEM3_9RHOB|nr:sugar transferase [Thalassobius vesicularis]
MYGESPVNIRVDTAYEIAGAGLAVAAPEPRFATGYAFYRDHGKRALDIAVVLIAAPVVALVTLVLALMVMSDGKSPFYSQNRVGLNGRVFRMWKLRSMVTNADAVLEGYLNTNPEARAEWDRDQKLKNDPRITRIGKLIRATSLDELPQLFNVLIGDMSLVGPRPIMATQRVIYPGTEYYAMRPGITGYWQISVRNESSFRQRAGFDAEYFGDLSLGTDLKVVAKTFGVVLKATGH